ncbi:MAG: phosphoglycerate mutase family protein [Cyclobacteriaceae bacterium]
MAKQLLKTCTLLIGILAIMISCGAPESDHTDPVVTVDPVITTLILVRHAEKVQDGSPDPVLTEKGTARAALLADMVREADVDAIYTTPYERNRLTVRPTAETLGLTAEEYDPSGDPQAFLDEVIEKHKGKKVLIAGHSNTVPHLLNALVGDEQYQDLPDSAYDNLYMVSATETGSGVVTNLQFSPAQADK